MIDSKKTVKHLRELAKVLESKSWVESIVVLETAKIPVLKLVSAESSVPIDVTFESAATHSGLLARDLIKRYAEEIPELYPLAILFKQLLRERGLNDAYTGGLSSYSVVLMLIHFSQLRRYAQPVVRRLPSTHHITNYHHCYPPQKRAAVLRSSGRIRVGFASSPPIELCAVGESWKEPRESGRIYSVNCSTGVSAEEREAGGSRW